MSLNTKKDFWVLVINNLINYKNPVNLTEGTDWENKLRAKSTWREIETYAYNICQDIFPKATQNQDTFPTGGLTTFLNYMGNNTSRNYWDNVWNTVYAYGDLANVLRDKIGFDPEDNTLATDGTGNNILDTDGNPTPQWKHEINEKLPLKLTDIPAGLDLADLIYQHDLYQEIAGSNAGLIKDIITKNLTGANQVDKYGFDWGYKVNRTRIQEYKDAETNLTTAGNHIGTILGLAPTDIIPNNWYTQLAKQTDLATANATIATLTAERDNYKTNSDEYDRIHTKLSGKVSDSELDALINTPPPPMLSYGLWHH